MKSLSETTRWVFFVIALQKDERFTKEQIDGFLEVWGRAQDQHPALRYPAVGEDVEGNLYMSWRYTDLPDVTLSIDVHPSGRYSWFYKKGSDDVRGTENDEGEPKLPDCVFDLLSEWVDAEHLRYLDEGV